MIRLVPILYLILNAVVLQPRIGSLLALADYFGYYHAEKHANKRLQ